MPLVIGIFGGTFDPVHNGHLLIAESAWKQLSLDRLLFVPNARSPLKSSGPTASFRHRVAMLRLAIDGHNGFDVSEIEGERGGTSYTIDTVLELADSHEGAKFYLIVGADALRDFHLWRNHEEILKRARLAYVDRSASEGGSGGVEAVRIDMPLLDVSSTLIRERIHQRLPVESLVPQAVATYIHEHGLYNPGN